MTTPNFKPAPVTYQNIGTKQPVQLVQSMTGDYVAIYNGDVANVLLVAPSFNVGLTNAIPIQPLTTAVVDGSRQQYGLCLVQPGAPTSTIASATVAPGATQINPSPAQIAAQISLSGIGLLNQSKELLNAQSVPIAVGTPLLEEVLITGTGYDIDLIISAAANAACSVELQWFDVTTGLLLDDQLWWILPGGPVGNHQIVGHGPVAGSQLAITVTSFTNTITATIILFQNSRPLTRHDWRSFLWSTSPVAGNLSANEPTNGLIAANNHSLATGIGTTYNLPLFAGRCKIIGVTSSNTTDGTFQITDLADQTAAVSGGVLWRGVSNAQGYVSDYVTLPRSQCAIALTNHNAGTQTLTIALVTEEY